MCGGGVIEGTSLYLPLNFCCGLKTALKNVFTHTHKVFWIPNLLCKGNLSYLCIFWSVERRLSITHINKVCLT